MREGRCSFFCRWHTPALASLLYGRVNAQSLMKHERILPPILQNKTHDEPSLFEVANLLREARRQKNVPTGLVPEVCLLDPDGDIVRYLKARGQAHLNPFWACYHTKLYDVQHEGQPFGIVGCAVGASFAVLVAEELFASGCRLLLSVTSAGQIVPKARPPYFILIDRALRDEGTSYHYLPPSAYAYLQPTLRQRLHGAFEEIQEPIYTGATWTTDAPFRETPTAIEAARREEVLAVEMEAAALYAFAEAQQKAVVCFAHVTNQMATIEGDFEKGVVGGSLNALDVATAAAKALLRDVVR